jgi:hypothetical protein
MLSVMLDTSVLWPSLQRDFLLSMAALGLYRPLWSEAILEELHEHELLKLVRRGASPSEAARRSAHLLAQMRTHFDDAIVSDWEHLEGSFGLPDVDDEHVVAAAVVGGARIIVTNNLVDFPVDKMPTHIEVHDATSFAVLAAAIDTHDAILALNEIAKRHLNPPESSIDILDALVTIYGMVSLGELLRPLLAAEA